MDLSFLGGFLWIAPLGTLVGAVLAFLKGWKNYKGGSERYIDRGRLEKGEWVKDGVKIPLYKNGYIIFSFILVVATIGILLMMYSDR